MSHSPDHHKNKNGWSTARSDNEDDTSYSRNSSTSTLESRMHLHDKLKRLSKCDLETPASIIANVNIKQLLTPAAFDCLPTHYQNELIQLLPETDRIALSDDEIPFAMTVNALSNEFFAKSCVEYRDRLRNGEFCAPPVTSSRADIDPVVWECDTQVLCQKQQQRLDIPKAGQPFICTKRKKPHLTRAVKNVSVKKVPISSDGKKLFVNKLKKPISATTDSKSLLKSSKPVTSIAKSMSASMLAQKAVSKAKAVSNSKTREKDNAHPTSVAGVKRPRSEEQQSNDKKTINVLQTKVGLSTSTPKQPNQVVVTKFKKVTESSATGAKVTKVLPVVVRNPHGQVVTTLANCNPLLTQMIKNPVDSQTATAVKLGKAHSLMPKILKRDNQLIVTLRTKPKGVATNNNNGINKAVTEVISKVKTSRDQQSLLPTSNGNGRPTPVIVTVNSANGALTSKLISTAVNMERSKQICDSSKQTPPTLNLERSYQICKEVLGKTDGAALMVVGPGGKRKIISKPVRNRLVDAATSNLTTCNSSDIPIYRAKHRGKSTLTLSSNVFLAMKKDEDGYATKAYKRKTAFKQKPKKKLSKLASKKAVPPASTPKTTEDTGAHATDSTATITSASSVTLVTPTLFATQPVLSVTESKSNIVTDVCSLLDSCMCNKRALIICRKCGAFCHAECTHKEQCLACLGSER